MVEQTAFHFSTDGWRLHTTSDDAKKQLSVMKQEGEARKQYQGAQNVRA